MKLSDWAKKQGISYLTAYRWFKDGKLPVEAYQSDSGTIIVKDESDHSEQVMAGSTVQNDAMSLFLKKTVEFSKSNSTVEDFAAYVLSNFQLQLNTTTTGPKYSKNRPKSEDVQKHFQQFIPKGEKPKPNSFIIEPDKLDELAAKSDLTPSALVEEIHKAANPESYSEENTSGFIKYGDTTNEIMTNLAAAFAPDGRRNSVPTTSTASVYVAASAPAVEGIVSRSVDFNTTPQQINYTGSTNSAFNNSLSSSVISGDIGGTYPPATVQSLGLNSADSGSALLVTSNNTMMFSGTKLPEIASAIAEQPRARRGRPSKKNKV